MAHRAILQPGLKEQKISFKFDFLFHFRFRFNMERWRRGRRRIRRCGFDERPRRTSWRRRRTEKNKTFLI